MSSEVHSVCEQFDVENEAMYVFAMQQPTQFEGETLLQRFIDKNLYKLLFEMTFRIENPALIVRQKT